MTEAAYLRCRVCKLTSSNDTVKLHRKDFAFFPAAFLRLPTSLGGIPVGGHSIRTNVSAGSRYLGDKDLSQTTRVTVGQLLVVQLDTAKAFPLRVCNERHRRTARSAESASGVPNRLNSPDGSRGRGRLHGQMRAVNRCAN